MREAAELAWQRPSGLGAGGRHTCSRHVGPGTCWEEACTPWGTCRMESPAEAQRMT